MPISGTVAQVQSRANSQFSRFAHGSQLSVLCVQAPAMTRRARHLPPLTLCGNSMILSTCVVCRAQCAPIPHAQGSWPELYLQVGFWSRTNGLEHQFDTPPRMQTFRGASTRLHPKTCCCSSQISFKLSPSTLCLSGR